MFVDTKAFPETISADPSPNTLSPNVGSVASPYTPSGAATEDETEDKPLIPKLSASAKKARCKSGEPSRPRVRKKVPRVVAVPHETDYRIGLKKRQDDLAGALKTLPEGMKSPGFAGKEASFEPSKGTVLDGALHVVR
jgi:hypothetical protein